MRHLNLFFKRVIDIFGSMGGILLLSPLLLIIAGVIKTTSKGPVFFKQQRVGKHGKLYNIIKFRTMINGAEKIGSGIFTNENDFRITRFGKFLRKTSLDELPQLINVLKGNMSLVGPRPPVPDHPYSYQEYTLTQKKRFTMKPGITGLAQVKARNAVSWDERIEYDLEYIERFNLLLDFKLIIQTFFVVVFKKNIYRNENNR